MGMLPRALKITFEVQSKRNNEKITRKKKSFQLLKCVFLSLFCLFEPSYFQTS
jgi:hypothetical protein